MTPPAAAPARPPRPTPVTVAFWLQVAAVVVLLALIGFVVWQAFDWNARIDRVARAVPDADPTEVDSERFGNIVMTALVGLPALFLAGWLGGTAVGLRRGSNIARILVFVAGGFQLLLLFGQGCTGVLMIPFLFALGEPEEWDPELDGPYPPEESKFLRALYDDDGGVLREDLLFGLGAGGWALVVALTLAVVVLLALPAARHWYVPSTAEVGRPVGPPAPATFMLPPGYMICPDPRAHGAPPHPPTAVTPAGAPAVTPAEAPADASAETVAAPDPETPRN
ncbi:hypothetical protein [Micromonospora coxensis]|uniref:Uncharacterized protein n=1 Tax=Micromonospora coxensis TaxID=356852 RepID=A0A1C5IU32_9ACTN|nr:hypothetical protein [Micromonospora coxensis]SCG61511.1 hypothetical protein GA0070614_3364 [Micromonospora coxensis]